MKKSKFITDFKDIPTPRQKMPELSQEERRLNFKEVELGFTEEMVVKEAKRCLSCRRCIGCGLCLAECDQKAIVYDQSPESIKLAVDSIILVPGFEKFDPNRKGELGYGKCFNVVTSIEFERILSPTGPYGGVILRPFDGEAPKKIAFVQCVGSRDEMLGANFCSNLCCMQSLKQASIAQQRIPGLEVKIFHKGIRPFGKGSENYYRRALNREKLEFVEAEVTAIEEDSGSGSVTLKYSSNGQTSEEQFGLAVLAVGLHSPESAKSLSRSTKIKLNKYGFGSTDPLLPVESTEAGVFLAGGFKAPTDLSGAVTQGSAAAAKVAAMLSSKRGAIPSSSTRKRTAPDNLKVGVFFCEYGARAGKKIQLQRLKKVAENLPEVEYVGESLFLCLKFGREEITNRIADKQLNGIVVAPCYKETHTGLFENLGSETGAEIIDIGELGSIGDESQLKDKFKSALANLKTPERQKIRPIAPAALIIGGGLSGMTAALDIANQGFEVHLLEKEEALGGWFRDKEFLLGEGVRERYDKLVIALSENKNIHLHLNSKLKRVDGEVGAFKATVSENGKETTVDSGVMVVATGAEEYKPTEFLYGESVKVITQSELAARLSKGEIAADKVVMIQCVGSRNDEHPYCSRDCCQRAIENSLRMKNLKPGSEVYILHRDIRVYDFAEDIYSEAMERGVKFIRFETIPRVRDREGLTVTALNVDNGEEISLKPELLVLSNGMVPPQGNPALAEVLGVTLDPDGFFPGAAVGLRPAHPSREGVFVCGLAHSPMSTAECLSQATAVAGKAGLILSRADGRNR